MTTRSTLKYTIATLFFLAFQEAKPASCIPKLVGVECSAAKTGKYTKARYREIHAIVRTKNDTSKVIKCGSSVLTDNMINTSKEFPAMLILSPTSISYQQNGTSTRYSKGVFIDNNDKQKSL